MIRLALLLPPLLVCLAGAAQAAPGDPAAVPPRTGILLVAEQSGSLCPWYQAGYRNMPLVHVSARLNLVSPQIEGETDRQRLEAALSGGACADLAPRTGSLGVEGALFDPDSYLTAALRLEVVGEIWWVLPSRQPLPSEESAQFREWLRGQGLPEGFLGTLRFGGREVRGEWEGRPVHIVTLADLPPLERPALVGIDAEYLSQLLDDPIRESAVKLLGDFLGAYSAKVRRAESVVVSSSFLRGRVPLGYAYLGSWVRDSLASPQKYARGPAQEWLIQAQVEYLNRMLSRDRAYEEAVRLAEVAPHSPVPWFDQAQIAVVRGDAEAAAHFLEEAVRRDPAYVVGYPILAQAFDALGSRELGDAVFGAGMQRHPGSLEIGLPLASRLLGLKDFERVLGLTAELAAAHPAQPMVDAFRAFALRGAGRAAEAAEAMARFGRRAPRGAARDAVLGTWKAVSQPAP